MFECTVHGGPWVQKGGNQILPTDGGGGQLKHQLPTQSQKKKQLCFIELCSC